MRNLRFSIRSILFLILMIVIIDFNGNSLLAEDAQIVKIQKSDGDNGAMMIDPSVLTIKKGTVVIWLNDIEEKAVQVVFKDGRECRDLTITASHVGFQLDSNSCYAANLLSYSATTSLKFTDAGTFAYYVVTKDNELKAKGNIIVKDG